MTRNRLQLGASLALALSCLAGGSANAAAPRDGQHDFDFDSGRWHTHIRRVLDPFAADPKAIELDGTVTVRPAWSGRAWLEEIEVDGPKGHWEGMSLFLYDPQTGRWGQNYANAGDGAMTLISTGAFRDGQGEFAGKDTLDGRPILVRIVWSDIKPDSHDYAEYFSADGGATWKLSFIAHKTRLKP